ncbi:hypothetical protein B0H17DRAFT_935627 [Mycena rosella]|uniref:DM2 domain-containing protein n=1 Tax=Mycena rosella TaxID=1033263 RepID=A0AAD7DI48_MYCRO|nr:hypothetical protein B0H17DRAFT_935627 [Mycena rosella]
MAFDFGTLEPYIEEILSAPGTDLATISAKRVRKQLQQIDPSLTAAFLKENRDAVDVVIARVFEKVQGSGSQDSEVEEPLAPVSRKRRQSTDEGSAIKEEEDATDGTPPPAKKAKKAVKRELSDAELARQLSTEINGRARRSNVNGKPKAAASNGTTKKRKSKAKSAEMVDTDDDSDASPSKRPASKKRSSEGGAARGGFAKPYLLSEPLAAVLGVESMSRPQVVKQLWVYIKSKDLQNPNNRREIICDPALRPVFNVDKIDMFKMNKVLGQ